MLHQESAPGTAISATMSLLWRCSTDVSEARCGGLDSQHNTVVAGLLRRAPGQPPPQAGRTFRTITAELWLWADWRQAAGWPHVAMASPGGSGRPGDHLREGLLTLLVVKAPPSNAVPGRKTAGQAAEWLAELRRPGLLRGRFLPSTPPRPLRERTRHRTPLGQARARRINRVQAALEDANSTRAAVVTEMRGVSARARLEALMAGPREVAARAQRDHLTEAGQGDVTAPHRCLLPEDLRQIDAVDDAIARVRAVIEPPRIAEPEAMPLGDTSPGGSQRTAERLSAAMGPDRGRFPTAKHLASGAGMCPGHQERAGTRLRGKPRQGRRWLRQVWVEAAPGAATTQQPPLAAQSQRRAARRGRKRALMARGPTLLLSVYDVLTRNQPSPDLGTAYFDTLAPHRVRPRVGPRLARRGYQVSWQPSVA